MAVVLLLASIRPCRVLAQGSSLAQESSSGGTMNENKPGTVNIPQPPSVTMTAVPSYGAAPMVVGFFVNGVDPEGEGFVSYFWTFGDGQVSMDPPLMFFHTYNTPGSYVATVSATTADGRVAVAYVGIVVRPPAD
jgi:PKD repeat protein